MRSNSFELRPSSGWLITCQLIVALNQRSLKEGAKCWFYALDDGSLRFLLCYASTCLKFARWSVYCDCRRHYCKSCIVRGSFCSNFRSISPSFCTLKLTLRLMRRQQDADCLVLSQFYSLRDFGFLADLSILRPLAVLIRLAESGDGERRQRQWPIQNSKKYTQQQSKANDTNGVKRSPRIKRCHAWQLVRCSTNGTFELA